ncbi:anthranilate synthase component I family protein [Nocardioides sp. AX2bis]|uniref:anthranilate synthase component I family protein n=1 Tax=Nocardioides sp. AX2bis TaxID=2653157 RepID=UPI0012F4609D|nr:anthranilate synthase component I family protein [Nocardioides sp. AX2bis]VXB95429.1 Anthranilate synthase [Nocardioides sp. AX2bis]
MSPAEALAAVGAHPRSAWLDGPWTDGPWLGLLDDADPSLTYDAATRTVTRHAGGRADAVGDDPFAALEDALADGPADARWVGWAGYAARPDLPALTGWTGGLPDAVWMRPSRWVAVRPDGGRVPQHGPGAVVGHTTSPDAEGPPGDDVPAWYAAAFAEVQEQLHAGNTYEVNLTYREDLASDRAPLEVYAALRTGSPAPYAALVRHDLPGARGWMLGSSPERYARVELAADGSRRIETRPIKGTLPRDADPVTDAALAARLAAEPRFRAENLMIVDLLRHDLAVVGEPGSVEVPSLMAVESYPGVHQLVSTVRARLRPEVTTVGALRSLFPAGSMTGAPKRRTMEVIGAVEGSPRGPYAGAVGWVGADGRADLGVVIRTLTTAGDDRWQLGTGGGVTVQSTAAQEWEESRWKAARLRAALLG